MRQIGFEFEKQDDDETETEAEPTIGDPSSCSGKLDGFDLSFQEFLGLCEQAREATSPKRIQAGPFEMEWP